jgi:hypothetical protein
MHEALTKYSTVCMKMIVLIFFTFEKMNLCFFNFESIIEHDENSSHLLELDGDSHFNFVNVH